MTEPPVLVERRDRVLVITLNRPAAKNAVNLAVAQGVAAAVDALDADPDLSVGVLTGAGGTFCAGFDLKAFQRGETATIPGRGFAGLTRKPPSKPLIAAVEGFALAGGTEIALSCDLIVAAENARFGLPEVKRGLVAAGGGLIRLPRRIPYHLAMELALTGDPLTAAVAAEANLVNRLVPVGEALPTALELAARLAQNGPLALRATAQIVRAAYDGTEEEGFARQAGPVAEVFASNDAKEGAAAFTEKRSPRWTGT